MLLLNVLFCLIAPILSYKILIYNPTFAYSHFKFGLRIADLLANAGHEVTVIIADLDTRIKFERDVKYNIYFIEADPAAENLIVNNKMNDLMWMETDSAKSQFELFDSFYQAIHLHGKHIINNKELETFVINEKFDFGYSEVIHPYIFGLFNHWKIPAYASGSAAPLLSTFVEYFGAEFPLSYTPTQMRASGDKMNYFERIENAFSHLATKVIFSWVRELLTCENYMNEKFGNGFFNVEREITGSSFIFINTNIFIDINFPKSAKMLDISGIGIPKPKNLSIQWEDILNKREKNVIISFGSICLSHKMPQEMKDTIVGVIKNMPNVTFLWKYEVEDGIADGIDNLVITKWLPQNDLLNSDKVNLIITHGGLNSLTESLYRGKKTMVIPIFGDQLRNGKLIERAKTGLSLHKRDLKNNVTLFNAIKDMLTNDEYQQNADKLAKMLANQPINPKDVLIKYFEFACEFGKFHHLDLASSDMNFVQYYMLDIIAPFICIAAIVLYLLMITIIRIVKKLFIAKIKIE
uniref:Glucuronosyltransferase n=1 Tax=Rhabditophanes sp. KR3021 TaxID=114890 RepID=A0AC35UFV7_9BILA